MLDIATVNFPQDGDTALMLAIKGDELDSAVVLMDAGVDLNIKNKVASESCSPFSIANEYINRRQERLPWCGL